MHKPPSLLHGQHLVEDCCASRAMKISWCFCQCACSRGLWTDWHYLGKAPLAEIVIIVILATRLVTVVRGLVIVIIVVLVITVIVEKYNSNNSNNSNNGNDVNNNGNIGNNCELTTITILICDTSISTISTISNCGKRIILTMVKMRFPKIRPVLEGPIIISVTVSAGPYPLCGNYQACQKNLTTNVSTGRSNSDKFDGKGWHARGVIEECLQGFNSKFFETKPLHLKPKTLQINHSPLPSVPKLELDTKHRAEDPQQIVVHMVSVFFQIILGNMRDEEIIRGTQELKRLRRGLPGVFEVLYCLFIEGL